MTQQLASRALLHCCGLCDGACSFLVASSPLITVSSTQQVLHAYVLHTAVDDSFMHLTQHVVGAVWTCAPSVLLHAPSRAWTKRLEVLWFGPAHGCCTSGYFPFQDPLFFFPWGSALCTCTAPWLGVQVLFLTLGWRHSGRRVNLVNPVGVLERERERERERRAVC